MKRLRSSTIVAAAALLALLAPLATTAAERFVRLSVENGLSQGTVQAVLEDHLGFVWFGTAEGLDRYDGYSFVVFRHDPDDARSVPHNVVLALYEDSRERLWVGTRAGLCRLDRGTDTFTRVDGIRGGVLAIAEAPGGTLWIGTTEGLFELPPDAAAPRGYRARPDDPEALGSDVVSSLAFDRMGRLWIGLLNGGVDLMRAPGRFRHYRHDPSRPGGLTNNRVFGLAVDRAGQIWVATYGGGLNILDSDSDRVRALRHHAGKGTGDLGTDLLTAIAIDRKGAVWIGTDGGGLRRYDPASGRFDAFLHEPADPASLSRNVVRTLYEDRRGRLWTGTYLGGVSLLDEDRDFVHFTHRDGDPSSLANPVVTAMLEDADGRVWVGTQGGFLHELDRKTGRARRFRFPSTIPGGTAITSLQERGGTIWVGTYGGGLARFDPARGSFTVPEKRLEVWGIAADDDGTLWLATEATLEHVTPGRGSVAYHGNGSVPTGRALLRDRAGRLWVGTDTGLYSLKPGASALEPFAPGDVRVHGAAFDAISMYEDADGRLWIGTREDGLLGLDPATGALLRFRQFAGSAIFSIAADAAGRLWLGTGQGLSRFDPRRRETRDFDLRSQRRGLPFSRGAALRARDGHLLFGGTDGVYELDPDALTPDMRTPAVVLTAFRLLTEPARFLPAPAATERVTLPYHDRVFTLEFAALDEAVPRRNRYAYRMRGLSDDWIDLGAQRQVTFANLDPRTYVFEVRASSADGIFGEAAALSLPIAVRPPFWMAWWFRSAVVVLLAAVLWTLHRRRVRHLTADIEERKRAADALQRAEAVAALGSLVAGVAHEVRNPLFSLSANLDVLDTELRNRKPYGETLSIVRSEVHRLRKLMEDLLEYGRPLRLRREPDSLRNVLDEATQPCARRAEEKGVRVAQDVGRAVPGIIVDRARLAQAFQNMLENAIQHTPAGGVVRLTAEEVHRDGHHWIECTIADSGPGIKREDLPHLFEPFFSRRPGGTGLGLSIAQRFVHAHGGTIAAENGREGGARLIVRLPVSAPSVEAVAAP